MPEEIRKMSRFEFYRNVGCDIMQFGGYGIKGVHRPSLRKQPDVENKIIVNPDGSTFTTTLSKWGNLTAIVNNGHPVKHPVETIKDLRILKNIWLNSFYEERKDDDFEKTMHEIVEDIGDDGIMVNTVSPSPVQQLLENDCGLINFYNLYQDNPEEMEELLGIMHDCRKQEYEILGRRTPLDCVIPVENTSSLMISPQLYEKLSLPQITDYVNILHKHNKLAVLHMCGHLKALLALIRDTGCDGINATTPPLLGDTTFEDVFQVFGNNFMILGGVFSPFLEQGMSKEKIWSELDKLYTPEIRNANLLLWVAVDGLPAPYERFMWVKEWFEKQK